MFDNRYQVFLADTAESKEIHYRLRYKIYCQEKQYEDTSKFPNQMEIDEYDSDAVHFLIREKQTGEWMAAVRLIVGNVQSLPIGNIVNIDEEKLSAERNSIAEISRFSILKDFRNSSSLGPQAISSIKVPEVMLGLLAAVIAYGRDHGISQWLFLCRRSLKRILNQHGILLEPVGPRCNYHGKRYPYCISLENSFGRISKVSPDVSTALNRKDFYYRYSELLEPAILRAA